MQVKEIIKGFQLRDNAKTLMRQERPIYFEISNISTLLDFVDETHRVNLSESTDEDITKYRQDADNTTKSLERISSRISQLLLTSTASCIKDVEKLQARYENLLNFHQRFVQQINKEFTDREISKQKAFNKSHLSIKLSKFKGFSSSTDIYSFKNDFDKLYNDSVPKRLQADILKNNHLEGSALSLVKHENNIDEIWARLKSSFGDVKFLLSNKLSELNSFDKLYRLKDNAKIVDTMSKIINVMKDLMNLAEKPSIEPRLYHGDGINQIYKLLGGKRTTNWFQSCVDDIPEGKQLWVKLLSYLERDLRIQQQKHLINLNEHQDRNPRQQTSFHANQTNQRNNSNVCFICNKTDHVATSGPNNTKLIQYFSCEKFVNMSPYERFRTLKQTNLCHQCLFPGAEISTGRHREGRCQRDFVCTHESHDLYPIKKHVLVCDAHKTLTQNEELLQQYKARCIRSNALPDYSKNIKLFISESNLSNHLSTEVDDD